MSEKRWLVLILALFMLLGIFYALTTPVFEASDELWHYPMVRHLADGNELPVQVYDPALAGPWKQEASQPPLYYYLAAALTFWIDASDMETIRWENPHVDNGVITEDGNINLTIHNPAWNSWQGTLLAVKVVRFFSVLLGAGTVFLTYLIAKEVEPNRPEIALGATAVNAFLPMFIFISASVNNDNLAIPLASLAILLLIRVVSKRYSVIGIQSTDHRSPITDYWLHWLLIGLVIGLAILTKEGTFGLFPIAVGTAVVSQWQAKKDKLAGTNGRHYWHVWLAVVGKALAAFLVLMIPVILIAGWWYWRNIQLYGDFLGWSAFIAVLGERAHPASLIQLWSERHGFLMSFWGLFGGVNVPMAGWIYTVLNGVLVASVVGFVVYVVRLLREWRSDIGLLSLNLQSLIANLFGLVERYFALLVCFLFSTAVVLGLIQWATTTWSSQGRLVFTALSALLVLLTVGLVGWLPSKPARIVIGILSGFMLGVAVLVPVLWIRPSYQPPVYASIPDRMSVNFGDQLQLVGYEVDNTAVQPGADIWLTLEWQVLAPIDRNWSIFVHLNDPVIGRPIAQRDMYPGQGLRPTTFLQVGERLVTKHLLTVPDTAVAPADLELSVGLYDFYEGERLPITEAGLLSAENEAVRLADLSLTAVPGETPNPVSINFEEGFELVGYELLPRHAQAGDDVDAVFYWRVNQPVAEDYTFFAQVVGEDTTRWGAASDLPVPTSQWEPGAVQPVPMSIALREDTPPDVYPLIIGLYTLSAAGEFERLQRITADGRPTDDFLNVTLVRVDE